MRTARTFILRLLLDSDDPAALRGVLRAVDTSEEHTFADVERLLALLRAEVAPDAPGAVTPFTSAMSAPRPKPAIAPASASTQWHRRAHRRFPHPLDFG